MKIANKEWLIMHQGSLNVVGRSLCAAAAAALIGSVAVASTISIPPIPLAARQGVTPMALIVAANDHKLFFEAYDDASDIDGDGVIDTGFNPAIEYLGLFNSNYCYRSTAGNTSGVSTSSARSPESLSNGRTASSESALRAVFEPVAVAETRVLGSVTQIGICRNAGAGAWSGNWLNYATTSRLDALRVVLYGGHRVVDTPSETVLRRAYIPQDAHSWAKEYRGPAGGRSAIELNGYDIADFTPFSIPSANRNHLFGSLTLAHGTSCSTLNSCSNLPPVLSVRQNVNIRVWDWASSERPVLTPDSSTTHFPINVAVCRPGFRDASQCRRYGDGATASYKPFGLLHEYGESDAIRFGLLTGSYDRNLSGGVLRDNISQFRDSIDPNTGIFTSDARIVRTFDYFRIRGYQRNAASGTYPGDFTAVLRVPNEGEFVDWGNPLGEMLFEGMRYFMGLNPSNAFVSSSMPEDAHVLPSARPVTWIDPYSEGGAAEGNWCSQANFITISDVNPSFDSNALPGSAFSGQAAAVLRPGTSEFNISRLLREIGENAQLNSRNFFVGQTALSGEGAEDFTPSPKRVTDLSLVRGFPEEPTRQGSFSAAGVAWFANTQNLRPELPRLPSSERVNVRSYKIGLASPLPRIDIETAAGARMSLFPMGKSVATNNSQASAPSPTAYARSTTIVDFYVESFANGRAMPTDTSINSGRFEAQFVVVYEAFEQGGDFDQDFRLRYIIRETAQGRVQVTVQPLAQSASTVMNVGYVVSGAGSQDGIYLVAQNVPFPSAGSASQVYFLNTPSGVSPGTCRATPVPAACRVRLALPPSEQDIREFTPVATGGVAEFLPDPLKLAARYGGFQVPAGDSLPANRFPARQSWWDSDADGVPDNYFFVQNPTRLTSQLRRALERAAVVDQVSSGRISLNTTVASTDSSFVFRPIAESRYWTGDLLALRLFDAGATGTTEITGSLTTLQWSATDRLPDASSRNLLTSFGNQVIDFSTSDATFSSTKSAFFGSTALEQERIVNYIRGDRSGEVVNGGDLRSRSLASDANRPVLGAILHSSPIFVAPSSSGSTPPNGAGTIFVAANSGFLHAFDAVSGQELFAYAPEQVVPEMAQQANPQFGGGYLLDGEMVVTPPVCDVNGDNCRRILVGSLGRAGKGVFALDVTEVVNRTFTGTGDGSTAVALRPSVAWSYSDFSDANLGFMTGQPVVAKLGDEVHVLFGNGYNSSNGSAALYAFEARTGAVRSFPVGSAGGNALATPGLHTNASGSVEAIFAGDGTGALWRFDVAGSNIVVGNNGLPVFIAERAPGERQPISSQVVALVNQDVDSPRVGQMILLFGTGRYIDQSDPADFSVQSIYGVYVSDLDPGSTITRSELAERIFAAEGSVAGSAGLAEQTLVRTVAPAAEGGDLSGRKGWFIDLTGAASSEGDPAAPRGERVVAPARIGRIQEEILMGIPSIIPAPDDPCLPQGSGFFNFFDPFTGLGPNQAVVDLDGDGVFDDRFSGDFVASFDFRIGMPIDLQWWLNGFIAQGTNAVFNPNKQPPPVTPEFIRGRIQWREVVQ